MLSPALGLCWWRIWAQHSQEVWRLIMTTPAPGSHVACPIPLSCCGVMCGPCLVGPSCTPRASHSSVPPPDAQEPTGAALLTMCQTLASSISIAKLLAHGPWARPMLDPMRFRLFSPSAAEIEERQTGLPTGQSGQHAQAFQQLGPVIPSPVGASGSHELPALVPASPGSRHLAPWHVCKNAPWDHKSLH